MLYLLVAVPFLFSVVLSGLICNALQLLTLLFIRPLSLSVYRRVNVFLMDLFWSQFIWLIDTWGRVDVRLFIDHETWSHFGKEKAIIYCNHLSDIDWLVGWLFAERSSCLGATRALMKLSVKHIPIIGWSMWFNEYIFLARDINKDRKDMMDGFARLRSFSPDAPMWMAIFPEGTRQTPEKLKAAQEYAASVGLPVPRHVMVPKTKGFVLAVQQMRDYVPYLYDVTVGIPTSSPLPTLMRCLRRKPTSFHATIRRIPTSSLPTDDAGLSKWLHSNFQEKDELLEVYKQTGTFGKEMVPQTKPSWFPCLTVSFWGAISASICYWVYLHLSLSPTSLAIILGSMVGFGALFSKVLRASKSEFSTPAKLLNKQRAAPQPASNPTEEKKD